MQSKYLFLFLIILFTLPTEAQFSIAPVYGYSAINATASKNFNDNTIWYRFRGNNYGVRSELVGIQLGYRINKNWYLRFGYNYQGAHDVEARSKGDTSANWITQRAYFNMSQFTIRLDNSKKSGLYYGGGFISNYWSDFQYDINHIPETGPYGPYQYMHDIGGLAVVGYSFYNVFVELNVSMGFIQSHGGPQYRFLRQFGSFANFYRLSNFRAITLMTGYRFNFDISKRHKATCPKF
jgi:hypothetical protein